MNTKINLLIENGPNVSFFCEGIAEETQDNSNSEAILIKLINHEIAGLITGQTRCQILDSGTSDSRGSLQKVNGSNIFRFKKENKIS